MTQSAYEELQNYKDELGDNDFEPYIPEVKTNRLSVETMSAGIYGKAKLLFKKAGIKLNDFYNSLSRQNNKGELTM